MFASTLSAADAGDIKIRTRRFILQNWAAIGAAVSGSGKGGTIDINASESVEAIGRIGLPFTVFMVGAFTLPESTGTAGDVNINTTTLQLRDSVALTVSSLGEGSAGNLNINARSIYLGNDAFLSANTRSNNTCRSTTEQNQFTVTGRGGLPPTPYETISDEATWLDLRLMLVSQAGRVEEGVRDKVGELSISNDRILEAQGWLINSKGEVILTTEVSTATPSGSGFSSQECGVQ